MTIANGVLSTPLTWAGITRAGDGNRTRMTSLEGWSSAFELRRQQPPNHRLTPVAYRLPRHRRDSCAPRGDPSGIVAVTGQREERKEETRRTGAPQTSVYTGSQLAES